MRVTQERLTLRKQELKLVCNSWWERKNVAVWICLVVSDRPSLGLRLEPADGWGKGVAVAEEAVEREPSRHL